MEDLKHENMPDLFGSVKLPDMRAPIDTVDLKVDFSKGVWNESSEMFVDKINYLGHDKGIFMEYEDFEKYLTFLLAQRVWMTTGKKYDKRVSSLYIPSLYAIALLQIGKAYDKELGINYIPIFEGEIFTYEEAERISNTLVLLQNEGLHMERGLPRDRRGTIDFLVLQFAINSSSGRPDTSAQVVAPTSSPNVVYAMLMAFFKVQQIDSVFNPRVRYGMINEYHQLLRSLINVRK